MTKNKMGGYGTCRIYKIESKSAGLVYYGSTSQSLSKRMNKHRSEFKLGVGSSSKLVLAHADAKISLLLKVWCFSTADLHKLEGQYIQNNECVNKNIPGQTEEEIYARRRMKEIKRDQTKTKCICGSIGAEYQLDRHLKSSLHARKMNTLRKNLYEMIRNSGLI